MFDHFCNETYQKHGDGVVLDMENAIKQDNGYDRLFQLCNLFISWLEEEHPEIKVRRNNYYSSIKKYNPSTIKRVIHVLRQYFEEFGHIEFSERKFRRMVRLPKSSMKIQSMFNIQQI